MKASDVLIILLLFSIFSCDGFYYCPEGNCENSPSYHPTVAISADLVLSPNPDSIPYEVKTSDQLTVYVPKRFDVTGTTSYMGDLSGLNYADLNEPQYSDSCSCVRGRFYILLNSPTLHLFGEYTLFVKPNTTHVFLVSNFMTRNSLQPKRASIALKGPFDGKVYRLKGKGHLYY